jgi:RNA polymerase sigma factor (sigma-70 family)
MTINGQAQAADKDRALWRRMREGDEQALGILFRRHYAMLYDYGMKISRQAELVKDSLQEIFVYVWEKRKNISEVDSVRAYLLVSLRRELLKSLDRAQQRQASHQRFEVEQAQTYFSPEDFLVMQEKKNADQRAMKKALQEIPPRLREALYLKTYDGLTYKEISLIMKVSPQVARNYVSEAFHRLREIVSPVFD